MAFLESCSAFQLLERNTMLPCATSEKLKPPLCAPTKRLKLKFIPTLDKNIQQYKHVKRHGAKTEHVTICQNKWYRVEL